MAQQKMAVDPVILSRLGKQTVAELQRNLWAIDCQTCGSPFKRFSSPVLGVRDHGDVASAMLHHRRCLQIPWENATEVRLTGVPTLSWRASVSLLSEDVPLFLVNPSCESALIRHSGDGWRVANLDLFERYGFVTELSTDPSHELTPLPGLTATLYPDRLSVDLDTQLGLPAYSWHCEAHSADAFVPALHALGRLLVGVTTVMRPGTGLTGDELYAAMSNRQIAHGVATMLYSPPTQILRDDDIDSGMRASLFDLVGLGFRDLTGTESDKRTAAAARAACAGDGRPLAALDAEAWDQALVMIALLHVMPSLAIPQERKEKSGEGVHVVTADPAGLHARWKPTLDMWKCATGLLSGELEPACQADMVFGTVEQFTAATSIGRGRLAIVVDGDPDTEVLRRYRRLLVV